MIAVMRVGFGGLAIYCYAQSVVQAIDPQLAMAALYAGLYAAFTYLALDVLDWVRA